MAKQRTLRILVVEHPSWRSIEKSDRDLLNAASRAAKGAYAPYSRFQVGAALRFDDGRLATGSNQENAAFPAGCCAERTALHAAMAADPKGYVEAIAVVVPRLRNSDPVSPCGVCRQALVEQELRQGGPIRVLLGTVNGVVHEIPTANDLLPLSFDARQLRRGRKK